MLPPVSVPSAPNASPAATATPDPDDDTPVQYGADPRVARRLDLRVVNRERAFGELDLADDHGARLLQPRHDGGVLVRHVVRQDLGAARRSSRRASTADPSPRSARRAAARAAAPFAALARRAVRRSPAPGRRAPVHTRGSDPGSTRRSAFEHGFGHRPGRQFAALDAAADLATRQCRAHAASVTPPRPSRLHRRSCRD